MAGSAAESNRVERAIYLVGALVLGLLGLQSLAGTGLGVYDYFNQFHNSSPGTTVEVNWAVDFLIGFLFFFGGLFLLFMWFRVYRRH